MSQTGRFLALVAKRAVCWLWLDFKSCFTLVPEKDGFGYRLPILWIVWVPLACAVAVLTVPFFFTVASVQEIRSIWHEAREPVESADRGR